MSRVIVVAVMVCVGFLGSFPQVETAALGADAVSDAYWPWFHGPRRDNKSDDRGLLKQWPDGGPRLIWQYDNCGDGFAGVSIVEGRIFTSGDFDDTEKVLALDMDGKLLWQTPNGTSWRGPYPGARTTPTFVDGKLYQLNPNGRLAALDAATGREVWAIDLAEQFGSRHGTWAMAENVAVVDGRVLCVAGGTRGFVVALDAADGHTVWVNQQRDEVAAYCSPIIVDYGGVRQYITLTQKSLISVDAATGELLWRYPHETKHDQNVTSPVYHDGYIFSTSGHAGGGTLLKLADDGRSVEKIWFHKEYDNCHDGVILIDGKLYGSGCRSGGKTFFCVDFMTGDLLQSDRKLWKLSLTYADGMLYGISRTGAMYLIRVTPKGYEVASQFDMPRGGSPYLMHPVVCGGRLYLRHDNHLYVYDVRDRPAS